jgi:hypothetical protein
VRRPTILAVLLALALSLGACGGGDDDGDEKSAEPAGPSKQEDIGAIEQVMLAYGATAGGDVCDYQAPNLIAIDGSLAECRRVNEDARAVVLQVENVAVSGDEATAVVKYEDGEVGAYGLRRIDGEWKISDFPGNEDEVAAEEAEEGTPPPVIESEEEPPEELPPATPRVIVDDLLKDFAQAEGSAACDFFSTGFIESQGGRGRCKQLFSDLTFGFQTVGLSFTNGQTRAIALLRSENGRASVEAKVTEPPESLYGGWRITKFVPQ